MSDSTNQVIFDKVAKHLLTQKVQCANSAGNCMYRGPNGLKCAVGALIPDEEYSPLMDDDKYLYSLNTTENEFAVTVSSNPLVQKVLRNHYEFTENTLDLLQELQNVHDCVDSTNADSIRTSFQAGLKKAALDFGLEYRGDYYEGGEKDAN